MDYAALAYVGYKNKLGLYIQLDMNGSYYLSTLELNKSGLVLISDMDKFMEGGSAFGSSKVVMNVRSSPNAKSNLMTQIDPNEAYSFNFTGKRDGQWIEVKKISFVDENYNEYKICDNGWIKYLGDDGKPNFHEYHD